MTEHPIEGLMSSAMKNIQKMVEVNTIVGDPLKAPDGTVIIPVSKVGFGFAAGGSEFMPGEIKSSEFEEHEIPFGGGSGGGVSITPVAFLVLKEGNMDLVHMDQHTHLYEKIIDLLPELLQRTNKSRKGKDEERSVEQKHHKKEEKEPIKAAEKEPKEEKGELESILTRFEI
ncbi:GerW family sporulation protein [Oceanobacillus jeddahense]|uniref:GerW family sporulation protein n=1 Tax=Oceanobacillus jeddahense TaxID=1462527 RepID=A0ABY5JN73_9BACI|nr:GerW family sporulation protein [Oceanobacillus jeddahense]UUI01739.1 GerW family sporulation protein [Oceanobacillus jeddahense]